MTAGCSKMENVSLSSDPAAQAEAAAQEEADLNAASGGSGAADGSDEAGYSAGTAENGKEYLSSGEEIVYYTPAKRKNPGDRNVTLYIWNVDSWKTVQYAYRDELTVRKLLDGLAYVTNWDLSTAAVRLKGQNCTIWWGEKCSLYAGLPAQQAKDYIVFNQRDLDATILDSVKMTITENLGLGYTLFYGNTTGGDLKLSDVGVTIPVAEAYSSFGDYIAS